MLIKIFAGDKNLLKKRKVWWRNLIMVATNDLNDEVYLIQWCIFKDTGIILRFIEFMDVEIQMAEI
ncbi:hypothetical protein KHA80_21175 [Anaerobacillus sp. HL2]|nr:hypothetical protein KHA80_21175 [Anaerobacillus sp. HL2]